MVTVIHTALLMKVYAAVVNWMALLFASPMRVLADVLTVPQNVSLCSQH